MMLRGMGFSNKTSIYLASAKIYRAEKNLAPLLKMFPLLHTKESLATKDELAPFQVQFPLPLSELAYPAHVMCVQFVCIYFFYTSDV